LAQYTRSIGASPKRLISVPGGIVKEFSFPTATVPRRSFIGEEEPLVVTWSDEFEEVK
jgi:hypothetical protein